MGKDGNASRHPSSIGKSNKKGNTEERKNADEEYKGQLIRSSMTEAKAMQERHDLYADASAFSDKRGAPLPKRLSRKVKSNFANQPLVVV